MGKYYKAWYITLHAVGVLYAVFSNVQYFKSAIRISQANQKTCTNVSQTTNKTEKNCFLRYRIGCRLGPVEAAPALFALATPPPGLVESLAFGSPAFMSGLIVPWMSGAGVGCNSSVCATPPR